MGFYFGSEREDELGECLSPTITPGEYVSALFRVIQILAEGREWRRPRYRVGLLYLTFALPGSAVHVFSELVRQRPSDQTAHRLLGAAYRRQGSLEAAVKHLEIALALLRREAAVRIGLDNVLLAQCESALLRLVLIPLHMRLGQREAARCLVREAQKL